MPALPDAAVPAGVAASATHLAGSAVGSAARRAGGSLTAFGTALDAGTAAAAPRVGSAVETAVEAGSTAAAGAARAVGEAASGFLAEPGVRLVAAADALRGARVGPPVAVRRWPWAVGAAVAGAAVGAGIAWLVQRVGGADAPGAQEPHELRAVVDTPTPGTEPSPGTTTAS